MPSMSFAERIIVNYQLSIVNCGFCRYRSQILRGL